jgi:hypothetical protein
LSLGQTQTSTSFRTSDLREGGNHLLFTPKRGWAGEVGVEYAIKPKSSFYSSFAFYQSGATQEDYRVIRQDPLFFFNLEEYSYNCWSLNTNYNMEIWRAGKVKLMAIAGLHIDRLIFNGDDSYGWVNDNDDRSPLRILSRNDALRKTNVGCNLGDNYNNTVSQSFDILDLNRKIVQRFEISSQTSTLQMSGYRSGMYYVHFKNDGILQESWKVVKIN